MASSRTRWLIGSAATVLVVVPVVAIAQEGGPADDGSDGVAVTEGELVQVETAQPEEADDDGPPPWAEEGAAPPWGPPPWASAREGPASGPPPWAGSADDATSAGPPWRGQIGPPWFWHYYPQEAQELLEQFEQLPPGSGPPWEGQDTGPPWADGPFWAEDDPPWGEGPPPWAGPPGAASRDGFPPGPPPWAGGED